MLKLSRSAVVLTLALSFGVAPSFAQTTPAPAAPAPATPAPAAPEAPADSTGMIEYFTDMPDDSTEASSALDFGGEDGASFTLDDLDSAGARYLRLGYTSGGETMSKVYRILVAPSTGRVFVVTSEGVKDLRNFLTDRGFEFDESGSATLAGDFNLDVEGIEAP